MAVAIAKVRLIGRRTPSELQAWIVDNAASIVSILQIYADHNGQHILVYEAA